MNEETTGHNFNLESEVDFVSDNDALITVKELGVHNHTPISSQRIKVSCDNADKQQAPIAVYTRAKIVDSFLAFPFEQSDDEVERNYAVALVANAIIQNSTICLDGKVSPTDLPLINQRINQGTEKYYRWVAP